MKPAHIKAPPRSKTQEAKNHILAKSFTLKRELFHRKALLINVRLKSFTLIELLIVIAILGVLAAAVVVAINPGKRMAQAKIAGALQFAKQVDYSSQFEGVGQWDFDDSSNPSQARDSSANGNNNGTIVGATYNCNDTPYHIVGSGNGKCALSFDGVNDYVNAGNGASLDITNAITFSAWVRIDGDSSESWSAVLGRGHAYRFDREVMNQNNVFVAIRGADDIWYSTSVYNLGRGNWHHLLATVNTALSSKQIKYYVDGSIFSETDMPVKIKSQPAGCFSIGTDSICGGHGGYFNGLIDDVRVYNRTITKTEIQQMYARTAYKHHQAKIIYLFPL